MDNLAQNILEPLLANVLQECIKNVNAAHATTGYPVMVIATTSDVDALPSSILGCFRHEVAVEVRFSNKEFRVFFCLVLTCGFVGPR